MKMRTALLTLLLSALWVAAHAQGVRYDVPTREGVTTSLYWRGHTGAYATVLLFPGGGGGFGPIENGVPAGNNFLVRSASQFSKQGFNVAIFGRPSDTRELDFSDRISKTHMTDVRAVIDFVRSQSALPVWLVGTSRGTISATATAIASPDRVAGLVLTSSVVNRRKPGAVPTQDLASIRVPVLVLHHARDACPHCLPHEVPAILQGLHNALIKRELMVSGGARPQGEACGPWHWHGFIGMEDEAVDLIAEWIKRPR
jgi:predicted alpha/beta-hydrolase family hydrolase